MRKSIKYIFRFLGWFFLGLIVLLIMAGLLIQTQPVKRKLSAITEKQASKILEGELSIGKIDGNLFSGIMLENILWKYKNDTVAFIKSIDASYRLTGLIHSNLAFHSIQIEEPLFFLRQEKDSSWNVQYLVKEEKNKTEKDTLSSPGNFSLTISELELVQGRGRIEAQDTLIPHEILNLNSKLSLRYSFKEQSLNLNRFSFQTRQPPIQLTNLSLNLKRNQENIFIEDIYLQTEKNQLKGQADYSNTSELNASVNLESSPLNLDEFEFYIPDLKLPVKPVLDIKVTTEENKLQASIYLSDNNQDIDLEISSNNFVDFITDTEKTDLEYKVEGNLDNIDLAYWLGNSQLDYKVNGTFNLGGSGTNPETATIFLDADFKDCIIKEKPVDKLWLSLNLKGGTLNGDVNGRGNFGTIKITPKINNLQKVPSYQLAVVTSKFNLAPLVGNDSLQSKINLRAQITGKSFDPETLVADAKITLSESGFAGFVLDTLISKFSFENKNFEIDSLWAESPTVRLQADGNYNLAGYSDITFFAEFDGIDEFESYIPLDSIYTEGEINAQLTGNTDSLGINSRIELKNLRYNTFNIEILQVNGSGKLVPGDTTFSVQFIANNFVAVDFALDSISGNLNYYMDSLSFNSRVDGKDLNSSLGAHVYLGETKKISLSDWDIDYKNQHLELLSPPAIFEMDSSTYRISNFKMASNASDSAQFIRANGSISRSGNEDFKLEVANVNIENILENFEQEIKASGILNVNVELQGTASNPEIKGNFLVDEALFNGYDFIDFNSDFSLSNNRLNFQSKIVPRDSGRIELKGKFPLEARLDSLKFNFNPEDNLNATFIVDRFPLDVLQTINIREQIEGVLHGEVNLSGTLKDPVPEGNLRLLDASFKMPEYGINYQDIVFDLDFLEDSIRLDSFYIRSDDGVLQASGNIDFNSAFYKGDVNQSEIKVRFNKFNPFNHRQFNMQISGDASLKGKKGDVVFDGDLIIPEGDIYLPALMNTIGKINSPDIPQPILIREMEKQSLLKDTSALDSRNAEGFSGFDFTYLDDFTGKLNINIPKNTWIKNKQMHIEISGDLELIKNAEFFELFGSVDVVRGQYDLLGKTFIIDDGTVTFRGGEEMMPLINIAASYTFRNLERAEQELSVIVSGTSNEPKVEFKLDEEKISEGDALSYILFGKSMNELTLDQQQNVSGKGDMAGTAASALLFSQLTRLLGNNINLDYIDIKSDGDFNNATVAVGKYITKDLFVSYEQRFGETNKKEMAKYEVKLEYELFRFLFFQLNNSSNESGFDIIFKLKSKKN